MRHAGGVGELGVAAAVLDLLGVHLPVFQRAGCQVSSEEDVETGVNIGQGLFTSEDDTIKFLENLTDLSSRIPTIGAICRDSRS